jgi:hypothetical protein
MTTRLITENSHDAGRLRLQMEAFYRDFSSYTAFMEASRIEHSWPLMLPTIENCIKATGSCRILEFGSGKTGFAEFLRTHGVRNQVSLTLHDITPLCESWLKQEGDQVICGPILNLSGKYDLIFSTFVLEHMTNPSSGLIHLWDRLAPGGSMYLICPRYDLPFYLPPSCDHLSLVGRFLLGLRVAIHRVKTVIQQKPAFLLLEDLAMFHLPWKKDRDAVHLVSQTDLKIFFKKMDGQVYTLSPTSNPWHKGIKDWIVKNHLTLCLRVDRLTSVPLPK